MALDWAALLAEALTEEAVQAPESACSQPETGNTCTPPGTVLKTQTVDSQGIDEKCSRVPGVPTDFDKAQVAGGWRDVTALAPRKQFGAWRVFFSGRSEPLEVYVAPPMTHTEVLAIYSDAHHADPIREDCSDCRYLRRPGRSNGYCGGNRPDLLPAYGPGHPLRRLPEDGGASCPAWDAL